MAVKNPNTAMTGLRYISDTVLVHSALFAQEMAWYCRDRRDQSSESHMIIHESLRAAANNPTVSC